MNEKTVVFRGSFLVRHPESISEVICPASAALLRRIREESRMSPAALELLYDVGTKRDDDLGRLPDGRRWRKIEAGDEALSIGEYIDIERFAIAKGHINWTWLDVAGGLRGHLSKADCAIPHAEARALFESGLQRLQAGQLPYSKGRPRKARCWSRRDMRNSCHEWFSALRAKGALLVSSGRESKLFLSGKLLADQLSIEFNEPVLTPYPSLAEGLLTTLPEDSQRRLNSLSASRAFRWLRHDPYNWM